jgi:DNA polymerase-3 subunit alpha
MVFFKLDDFSGSCECLMFSKVYALCENLIVPESTILVAGKLESSGDAVKLHVDEAFSMDDVRLKLIKRLGIILDSSLHQPDSVAEIKNLMENNVGTMPVSVCLKDDGNTREFHLDYKVALNQDFVQKLITLLGEDSIVYFAN